MPISPLKDATEVKARFLPRDRVAIAWRDRRLTWREVNRRADLLAACLHKIGLRRGDTCAFLFPNRPEFIETNLAIQALGAIPVPVNFRYVAEELRYVLEDSQARCFLFHADALPLVAELRPALSRLATLICSGANGLPDGILSYEGLLERSDGNYPKAEVAPQDTAVIIYTGGTTGFPKGVMLTYENFRSNQEAIFSYLLHLLPSTDELAFPGYARTELQRKILDLFSHLTTPMSTILYRRGTGVPPVVLLEVKGDSGIQLPPLAVTLREGRPKLFAGTPPAHDFHVVIRMGEDFRKFVELKYHAHTWRGRLAVLPRLTTLLLSGGLRTQGSLRDRLLMPLANLRRPPEQEMQHIALIPPLFHLASYAFWLTFWLYQEGMVYLPPGPDFRPGEILAAMERERISWLLLVPTMWKRCLKELREHPRQFPVLRVALTGAAVMPASCKREILEFFPNALVVDGFGQTEMAPVTTLKVDADPDTVKDRSVGKLLDGLEAKIVNEEAEQVADGEVGELCYRGPSVMKGYFRDEEKTREVLDAEGWFHSGDLAYRGQDGEIYTVERKQECINSGGEKIFPQELEEIILKHPEVEDVCVIGVPDEEWGETVRAVVVLKPGATLDQENLNQWCRGKMAPYKKPKSVVFSASLPTSPVGKVLRARIRELHGKP